MDKIRINPFHCTDVKELSINSTTVTATAAELNAVDGAPLTMTTTTTPGTNTCEVQLVFKDAAGVAMTVPTAGFLYISEVATAISNDPVDGLAAATNGVLVNLISHGTSFFTTTAAGLLGVTISHTGADSFWLAIVLPSGKLLISDECVVNGA